MPQEIVTEILGEGDDTRVRFTCWNCKSTEEVCLKDIQQERLDIKYSEIHPVQKGEPKRYFVRCPACTRFTSVKF